VTLLLLLLLLELLFLPFAVPLPLPLLLGLGAGGRGVVGGHDGSYCGGRGGSYSCRGHGVKHGGLSLGHLVVQLNLLEFEIVADGVEGGERL
jgi:hypothetical protein